MNLYHLRYFVTLAKFQHYGKAAEELAITQPSLSYAISSLEKELQLRLFEKKGRNVVLTKFGHSFLIDVEQSLEILDKSIENAHQLSQSNGGIDIAFLRVLGTSFVPQRLRGFLEAHPDKDIHFHLTNATGMSTDIIAGIKEGKYDVGFCSKSEQEHSIEFIPVTKQELILIVPLGHPLAVYDSIDLADTLEYPYIFFSKRSGLHSVIAQLFQKINATPNIIYEIEEDQVVAGLVASKFGIAVVPDLDILSTMDIKKIQIASPAFERFFYMARLKDTYRTPAVELFCQYILNHTDL